MYMNCKPYVLTAVWLSIVKNQIAVILRWSPASVVNLNAWMHHTVGVRTLREDRLGWERGTDQTLMIPVQSVNVPPPHGILMTFMGKYCANTDTNGLGSGPTSNISTCNS